MKVLALVFALAACAPIIYPPKMKMLDPLECLKRFGPELCTKAGDEPLPVACDSLHHLVVAGLLDMRNTDAKLQYYWLCVEN